MPRQARVPGAERRQVDGRVAVYAPGHPTAARSGWAMRHRLTAYDSHGARCRNCGRAVTVAAMQVLHLNGRLGDDHPTNLFVACERCAKIISFATWLSAQPISGGTEGAATLAALGALVRRLREVGPVGTAPTLPLRGSEPARTCDAVDGETRTADRDR